MATITSTQDGKWNDPTTWAGGVPPVDGDKVYINHTVTVEGTCAGGDDTTQAINVNNSNGVLYASRAADSTLTVRGNLQYTNGGTHDYGTELDPIPSTVTATIYLNRSSSMVKGKWAIRSYRNAGAFNSCGATKTLRTHLSADATTTSITVGDATGWNVGDEIVLAPNSTYATYSQATVSVVSGNDITISAISNPHVAGTRVINLTRNVRYLSYDSSYYFFVEFELYNVSTGTINVRNTEFFNTGPSSSAGGNPTNRTGISFYNQNSTTHNPFEAWCGNAVWAEFLSGTDGHDYYACKGYWAEVEENVFYGINGNAIYTRSGTVGKMADTTIIRCSSGFSTGYSQGGVAIKVDRVEVCAGTSAAWSGNHIGYAFIDCKFWSNHSRHGLFSHAAPSTFLNCEFDNEQTTNETPYFAYCGTNYFSPLVLTDCIFGDGCGATSFIYQIDLANPDHSITLANKNQDPSAQEIYTPTGTLIRDNDFYRSNSPSVRIDPSSADNPFSFSLNIFAPTGEPVIASGYIRKDSSYGSSNLPYVTLSGLGITADTYTVDDLDDEWQQFKVQGTQTSGTDGMLMLTFYVQSSAGSVFLDDVVAPVAKAVNVGEFNYWAGGLPVPGVLANFVSAIDVWNTMADQLTLSGSIGEKVVKTSQDVKNNQALIVST